MVIGRVGQSCAAAGVESVNASASATSVLGMIVSLLFRRDPGLLDDVRPQLDVLLDEGLQILRRAALGSDHVGADFGHLLLHRRCIERRHDASMQLLRYRLCSYT